MNQKSVKKIGIIDGMGAFAGARFFQILLEKIVANNLEFPEIILNAVSVDDFISDASKIKPALEILSSRVKELNRQKVTMIVMACNTAHIIHQPLSLISTAPFPSIVDLVIKRAQDQKASRIGILASPLTLKTKLYEDKIRLAGLNPFIPNQSFQLILETVIRHVLTQKLTDKDIIELTRSTQKFIKNNNLDSLILGCTELPLAFPKDKFKHLKIFDSLDILADSIINHLSINQPL